MPPTATPPSGKPRSFRVGGCLTFLLFFVISLAFFGMLYHSEQQLVEEQFLQQRTTQSVVTLSSTDSPTADNQNQLLHIFSSHVTGLDRLVDPQFSVEAPNNTLLFSRITEYCQWKETAIAGSKKKIMKPKTYELVWSPVLLSSELYRDGINHYNPPRDPFPSRTWASDVQVGDYRVASTVVSLANPQQNWFTSRSFTESSEAGNAGFTVQDEYLILPSNLPRKQHTMCTPGDIRVHYEMFQPLHGISVVAMQNDTKGTLVPWPLDETHQVALMQPGQRSSEEMIAFQWTRGTDWFMRLALFVWSSLIISAFGKAYRVDWPWLVLMWVVNSTSTLGAILFFSIYSYDVGTPSPLYFLALPVALLSNIQLYGALGNKMSFSEERTKRIIRIPTNGISLAKKVE